MPYLAAILKSKAVFENNKALLDGHFKLSLPPSRISLMAYLVFFLPWLRLKSRQILYIYMRMQAGRPDQWSSVAPSVERTLISLTSGLARGAEFLKVAF